MRILIQSKTFCYEEICLIKKPTLEIYLSLFNTYHILFKYKLRVNKLTILNINDINFHQKIYINFYDLYNL